VKLKSLLFSFVVSLAAIAAADSIDSKPSGQTQINQTEINQDPDHRLAHRRMPSYRVAQLVQQRGLASAPTPEQLHQLESAGAGANLIRTLSASKAPASPATQNPPALLKAAAENRPAALSRSELHLREALRSDPQNAALHFALLRCSAAKPMGRRLRRDHAIRPPDARSAREPQRLRLHFYRLDDAPNAIAEARTALSMDPQNAEAYQFLAWACIQVGSIAPRCTPSPSLWPAKATTPTLTYDMGIALHADGNSSRRGDRLQQSDPPALRILGRRTPISRCPS